MQSELLIKYSIGLSLALVCIIADITMRYLLNNDKYRNVRIFLHFIQMITLSLCIAVVGIYAEMALTDFAITFISAHILNFVIAACIALVIMGKLFLLANLLQKKQIEKGADPTSARIITRVFKITIIFMLILLFGEKLGMSLSGLMAFGGIGGIAIAMASKDILSNLFSGIMLYFDRPFNIGDWISSPDREIEGTVAEIGWRLTKIITFDHRPLYIPNSLFSTMSLVNPGRMTNRRIKTELSLRYEDADKVGAIVKDIKAMLLSNHHIDTKQTLLVNFNEFSDSSLKIMIYCFTKTTKWAEWLDIQQEVYLEMIAIVKKHGADFAYPTQTVYVEKTGN